MNGINNNKNKKISSKLKNINFFNDHLYTLNNDLNELFQKYKTIKQKRKLEEEREKLLTNKLKKLISKEKLLTNKIKKRKNKEKILFNNNKEIKINYECYPTIENKIIYNNNLKNNKDLESNKNNNTTFKKNSKNHRNISVDKNDIKDEKNIYSFKSEDRIKTMDFNDRISFISNKSDKRFNNSSKKESNNKIIIAKINNNKDIKYYYKFNNFFENKNNFTSNKIKIKKAWSNNNKTKKKKIKNKDEMYISQKDMYKIFRKDENNEKIITFPNYNKKINKNHSVLISSKEKGKIKNKIKKKIINSQSNNFEEKDIKISFKQNFPNTNNNSYNKSFLNKKNYTNKIKLKKSESEKSKNKITKIFKKQRTENSTNKNKEFKNFIDNTKIQKTLYNIYNIITKNKIPNNKKSMIHSHTIDFIPNINPIFKKKRLSFNKSIEKKKQPPGKNNVKTEKEAVVDYNLDEIGIKDYILSFNKNNKQKIFENEYNNMKIIKVAKAPNLEIKNDGKNKVRRSVIKFNNTKLLYPNRSIESYDSDGKQNNISYPALLLKHSKKKDNYSYNIFENKKIIKKIDYFNTDNNFYYNDAKLF